MNYEILFSILVLIFISLGILFNIKEDEKNNNVLNYTEARTMIKNTKFDYIIDVRSREEYNFARIQEAIYIPIDELKKSVELYDMNSVILLIEGPRAAYGKIILNNMGFDNVMYLKEGYNRLK
tara:strand:+ start:2404 stop:2772 length:369 start_codon:yes stop_codon:yes gene_type:complete